MRCIPGSHHGAISRKGKCHAPAGLPAVRLGTNTDTTAARERLRAVVPSSQAGGAAGTASRALRLEDHGHGRTAGRRMGSLRPGRSAAWTVATRHDNTLIRVDKQKGRLTWWHYRLSNLISPSGTAHDQDLANRVRIPHGPLVQAFPEAQRALVAIEFDPATEPPSSCPSTAP
jgi:hypothetical protein